MEHQKEGRGKWVDEEAMQEVELRSGGSRTKDEDALKEGKEG